MGDEEILEEKKSAEKFYLDLLSRSNEFTKLSEYTRKLSRVEWFISEILSEIKKRDMFGGFNLPRRTSKSPLKKIVWPTTCIPVIAECSIKQPEKKKPIVVIIKRRKPARNLVWDLEVPD